MTEIAFESLDGRHPLNAIPQIMITPGEIGTLIQVIAHIVTFLSEYSGSSEECRVAAMDLQSVSGQVAGIADLLEKVDLRSDFGTENLVQRLESDIERCREDVRRFAALLKPYHDAMCPTNPARSQWSARSVGRKLWWVLFQRAEVTELKRRIMQHSAQIISLANTLMTTQSYALCTQIAKQTGSPPVEVTDPFGRKMIWDYRACNTWESFNRTLRSNASGTILQYHIRDGRFIVLHNRKHHVYASNWTQFMRPGAKLQVYITLDQYNHIFRPHRNEECRRCREKPEIPGWKVYCRPIMLHLRDDLQEHTLAARLEQRRESRDGSVLGRVSCFSPGPLVQGLRLRGKK